MTLIQFDQLHTCIQTIRGLKTLSNYSANTSSSASRRQTGIVNIVNRLSPYVCEGEISIKSQTGKKTQFLCCISTIKIKLWISFSVALALRKLDCIRCRFSVSDLFKNKIAGSIQHAEDSSYRSPGFCNLHCLKRRQNSTDGSTVEQLCVVFERQLFPVSYLTREHCFVSSYDISSQLE